MKVKQRRKGVVLQLTYRITIPILVILYILTVIVGTTLLIVAERDNLTEQFDRISGELLRTQYSVGTYLEEMVRTASNLKIDQDVEMFFKYSELSATQKDRIAVSLKSAINMVPSIYSIYLVSSKNDFFMYAGKNSFKLLEIDHFYDKSVFEVLKGKSITSRSIFSRKVSDEATGHNLDLITVFGYNGYSDSSGPLTAVVVNMKASVLQHAVNASYSAGEAAMVVDHNGTVLTEGGFFSHYTRLSDYEIDINNLGSDSKFVEYRYKGVAYYIASTLPDIYGIRIVQLFPVSEINKTLYPGRVTAVILLAATLIIVTVIWAFLNHLAEKPITELVLRSNRLERQLAKDEKTQMMQVIRSIMQHGSMYPEEKRKRMLQDVKLPFEEDDEVFLMEILIHHYLDHISKKSNKEYEALIFGAGNIIEEIMSADTKCLVANRVANGSFYVIASPHQKAYHRIPDIISNSIESITTTLSDVLNIKVVVLYSTMVVPLFKLNVLTEMTEKAAENRPFYTTGAVIDYEHTDIDDYSSIYRSVFGKMNEYLTAMRAEDFKKADGLCEAMFDVSNVFEMRFAWSVMTMTALPMICSAYPSDITRSITEILNDDTITNKLSSAEEMKSWVVECHKKICESVRSYKSAKSYDIVAHVHEIINKNFNDPELNVAYVADQVGVSPNYLSSMYRKLTSLKLTERIQEVRLAAARDKLINSDMLVSDIARACGYAYNVGYFQQLFKRKYGLTPSQYREKNSARYL